MTLDFFAMDLLQQLYSEAIRWYNLPFTVLFGLVLIYWGIKVVLALFGAAFDFDFGGDADADADGFLAKAAASLSDGEAPFSVAVSFFAFFAWVLMMVLNHFFNPASVWALGIAIMAACAAVAFFITRMVLRFIARVIRKVFGMTPQDESFIGAIGTVLTSEVTEDFGQIEIDHDGVPLRFNVDLLPGAEPLVRGDRARIVREGRKGKTYLVEKTAESLTSEGAAS